MSLGKIQQERCPIIGTIQKILGGKWKISILFYITRDGVKRFGELQRNLGDITQSTLTKQLRELEADGFINRKVYPEIPPKVEYTLSDKGQSFTAILDHMKEWGAENLEFEEGLDLTPYLSGFNKL